MLYYGSYSMDLEILLKRIRIAFEYKVPFLDILLQLGSMAVIFSNRLGGLLLKSLQ